MGRMAALVAVIIAVVAQTATAGCPTDILDCNAQKQALCTAKQCAAGLVCRVNNCGACTAVCEPYGTVSIMSLGRPGSGVESGSKSPASSSTPTATTPGAMQQQPGKPCRCPRIYKPVCGWDSKLYPNDCEAKCAGVTTTDEKPDASGTLRCSPEAAVGVGKPPAATAATAPAAAPAAATPMAGLSREPLTCGCPKMRFPVCTTNGRIFENACLAKCAGALAIEARPDADGKCPPATAAPPPPQQPAGTAPTKPAVSSSDSAPAAGTPCPCPRSYMPVCTVTGKVFPNECLAKCAGQAATKVKPDADGKCPTGPTPTPAPAASAGADASNTAPTSVPRATKPAATAEEAGRPAAATKPLVASDAVGPAANKPAGACPCPKILAPVCTASGKFNNKCLAECAGAVVIEAQPDADGKCPPATAAPPPQQQPQPAGTAPAAKPAPTAPVKPAVSGSGSGSASAAGTPCPCPRSYLPVCTAAGKVYPNACLARCAGAVVIEAKPDADGKCPQ